jgi:hypothetical protein
MKMKRLVYLLLAAAFLLAACIGPHVHVKNVKAPPGQVKKCTGYNPASGKVN